MSPERQPNPHPNPNPCPECEAGSIVERQGKTGKPFWACNRFPRCRFTSPFRPIPEACPLCSSPYLVEKTVRKILWAFCPNPSCTHQKRLTPFS